MKARVLIHNNRGFPKQKLSKVNEGDYLVKQVKPDLVLEAERWFVTQWGGFRKIFNALDGYNIFRPASSSVAGLISARKMSKFRHLAHFAYMGHGAVPYICNYRTYMGEVCMLGDTGKTTTYINVHPTPSAFSSRFPDGSIRKKAAQKAWYLYMARVKTFAERQITQGGRDYVIIGGDFNASRRRVQAEFGSQLGGKAVSIFTSPSGYQIDHIVVVGSVRALDSDVINTPSDHDAFWVDLEFM